MTATLVDALMGEGELELDLDYDGDLVAALKHYRTLHVYQGEDPIGPGFILLWRTPARGGLRIGGRALDWRLGQDGDGAIVLDREYLACTNKLSNPGFELEALYWARREGTNWRIRSVAAEPYAGSWAAAVIADGDKDDVLATDEGGWEAREGNQFTATLRARRVSGSVGHLRLRIVFEGRFDPAQLLTNGSFATADDWTNTSAVGGDAAIESGHLRIGPTTKLQRIQNPSFEDGLNFWQEDTGDWFATDIAVTPVDGDFVVGTAAGGPAQKTLQVDRNPGVNQSYSVTPGERYLLDGWIRPNPGADGVAYIYTYVGDETFPLNASWIYLETVDNAGGGGSDWRWCHKEFDIPETKIALVPMCEVLDHTAGNDWYFDRVQLTRLKGNKAGYQHDSFAVTPERTYRVLARVTPDEEIFEGTLRASVLLTATGRDPIVMESPALERGDATRQLLAWDFTPPSGYGTAALSFVGLDVFGGSFIIDNASVTDADGSTVVFDELVGPTKASWEPVVSLTATAPEGTEAVRLEVVAEADASGWRIDDASLARVGTPAVSGDVIRSLLLDPDTGDALMNEGEIHGTDTLLFDKHFIRQDLRSMFKDVSRGGVVSPVREWRVNPDNSLDWGTAEQLFTDRTELVFAPGDLELLEEPTVEQNVEDRVTDVIVVGAERQLANGRRVTIIGSASNEPGPDDVDWYGNPVRRKRVVEDSTVDHKAYADALARWHLDQSTALGEVVQLKLADWRAVGPFGVGDWIYPWLPEAELEDLDNPVEHQGRTTYPKRVRALVRVWRMGAGSFRVEARAPDGSTLDISRAVRWENETTAEVTVGEVVPEFLVDPQGGAAGNQFLRWRASRPQ